MNQRRTQRTHPILSIVLWVFLPACTDRPQGEECYPRNPEPFAKQGVTPLVCGHEVGYLPETPEGIDPNRGPYHGLFCDPAPADGECKRCPTDEVLDYLRGRILDLMAESRDACQPPEVDHVEPACVTTPDQGTNGTCCYNVWYWGQCNTKG